MAFILAELFVISRCSRDRWQTSMRSGTGASCRWVLSHRAAGTNGCRSAAIILMLCIADDSISRP